MNWDVIIVVAHGATPVPCKADNGVTIACLQIARQLKNQGYRSCLVMNVEGSQNTQLEGVDVLWWPGDSYESLANCIQNNGGCHTLIENSSAGVFQYNFAEKHVAIMHNPHHLWGVETYGRSLYSLVQSIVCVSDHSRESNIAWGAPAKLTKTIHNGCDFKTFFPRATQRNSNRLIFVGGCSWEKGLDLILDAYESLYQSGFTSLELVVCGGQCTWKRSPELPRLQKRGWIDDSYFLNWQRISVQYPGIKYFGSLTPDEVATELSKAAFHLLPSRKETFGLVSVEAQACGCLPVLPQTGPFKETLVDGKTGFLYDEAIESALADKLAELLQNPPDESFRQAAVSHVRENFSWERAGKQYADLIESLPPLPRSTRVRFKATQIAKSIVQPFRRVIKACPKTGKNRG